MNSSGDPGSAFSLSGMAAVLVDEEGTVLRWSRTATELVGRTAAEVCGRPIRTLFPEADDGGSLAPRSTPWSPPTGRVTLQHRSGRRIEVVLHALPLDGSAELLILASPAPGVADWEQSASFLHSLLAQDRIAVRIHDTGMNVVRTNATSAICDGPRPGLAPRLRDAISTEHTEAVLRRVLETGRTVIDQTQRMRSPREPGSQSFFSLSAFRLEDAAGRPTGVAAMVTESKQPRRHVDLRHEAATRIGGSLDITRTAQDLADVLVPALGDLTSVDLAEAVLKGDEPPKILGPGLWHMHRAAVASASGQWPAGLLQPGSTMPIQPDIAVLRRLQYGETILVPDVASISSAVEDNTELIRLNVPERGHSNVTAPLFARGLMLGVVSVWRTEQTEPHDQDDADLLAEIASRAALSVDNARRYAREHRAAVALQQSLLPRATTDTPAAETTGLYRPAAGGADISGDWFDVIPLPSLRVAFVVGDVIGHGLRASATMGRLRTAVRTLADLELEPNELLTHLDALVQQLAAEAPPQDRDTVGATCLYAVYDPVSRCCTMASAGHFPPIAVRPDRTVQDFEVSPGPPLGVGGMPFETTTVTLEPGSLLALFTDGLVEGDDHDVDAGIHRLTRRLIALCSPDRRLDDTGRALLTDTDDTPPSDDIALLLARTRATPAENIASWEFPADPAVVTKAREAATRQLTAWGLDDLVLTTELIVSELVTNAIRYGGAPLGLRLIHEDILVCEVTDPSNTQPRLRRALTTDEGGRGLFLVAQLTTRWGSRYGQHGKTIWTEQPITTNSSPAL
ncbi:SpoIIE family protein phosphatase [Streptomyces sp. bgisy027]|uniref:ATP-binding SpoIIE family protein phosphatase n=1 Tax=Streptomyces sp. bgisy027 TaxID=3413770 RepID=UPI003D7245D2